MQFDGVDEAALDGFIVGFAGPGLVQGFRGTAFFLGFVE